MHLQQIICIQQNNQKYMDIFSFIIQINQYYKYNNKYLIIFFPSTLYTLKVQLIMNTSTKKQRDIDFNSLSFKISKPDEQTSSCLNPNNSNASSSTHLNPSYSLGATLPLNFDNISNSTKNTLVQSQNNTQNKQRIRQHIGFQDTQASNLQQETINPFRRTCHLFKHIQRQKSQDKKSNMLIPSNKFSIDINELYDTDTDGLDFIRIQQNLTQSISRGQQLPPTHYSLQNFDSFHKNQQNQNFTTFSNLKTKIQNKTDGLKIKQRDYVQHIRIEKDFLAYPTNIDELSLIMDDLTRQNLTTDIITIQNLTKNADLSALKNKKRRIRTQYEHQQQNKSSNINTCNKNPNSNKQNIKKQSNSTFFLTAAQSQSNQQQVKQFYFDLRKQQQPIVPKIHKQMGRQVNINSQFVENLNMLKQCSPAYQSRSIKTQIKEILINFICDVDILDQSQIDPFFVQKLHNCLISIKRIPRLPISNKKNQCMNIMKTCPDLQPEQQRQNSRKIQKNEKILTSHNLSNIKNTIQNKQNIKSTGRKQKNKSNNKVKGDQIQNIIDKSGRKTKNNQKNIYQQFQYQVEKQKQKQKQSRVYHKVSDLKFYGQDSKKQKRKWML